jgi:hypothetical protein
MAARATSSIGEVNLKKEKADSLETNENKLQNMNLHTKDDKKGKDKDVVALKSLDVDNNPPASRSEGFWHFKLGGF